MLILYFLNSGLNWFLGKLRHMTCKLFDDLKDICKVHKSVEDGIASIANIGFKSNELLQLKHILHMDLSDVKLNELLKSNNLDAQRTTCLMRKGGKMING
ncbi:hypothetical protein P8452_65448 [Trifolium repens]|nr:hypothetical protein P8452_65448 [Trifolium repens]